MNKTTKSNLASCLVLYLFLNSTGINAQNFTQITNSPISTDGRSSYGCAWGDFDNDGYQDLLVTTVYTENDILYHNDGNGAFTPVVLSNIINDGATTRAANWGDIDNDGDLDLFICHQTQNNSLYINNGDNTFTKVTTGDIVLDGGTSLASAWGDYDNDGYLDLFVSNFNNENDFLYHNNGDGTFTKITTGPVVSSGGSSVGCTWVDYDNDGFLDLYVANYGNDFLFHNDGNGNFTSTTNNFIVTDGFNTNSGSWADYDNDGDMDLFATNGNTSSNEKNILYQNNGNGSFTLAFGPWGSEPSKISTSSAFADYDNDGDLDLIVVNSTSGSGGTNNFLYENTGNGNFTKINSGAITSTTNGDSRGVAWADYDNDGDLDLFIPNEVSQNDFFFTNDGNSNHWININLTGTLSNKSAIGARVYLYAKIKGQYAWQMQEVSCQSGNQSQSSLNVEFGLDTTQTIDSLIIKWPSGKICKFYNLKPDFFYTISEDCDYFSNSLIQGVVFEDTNNNCALDGNEKGLANRLVVAMPGQIYATTDSSGKYSISVLPGNYQVTIVDKKYWQNTCINGLNVSITDSTGQIVGDNNLGSKISMNCIDLSVDVSTPVVRRCFNTNYFIKYCNKGTSTAKPAQITVEFDTDLIPQTSSLAWDSIVGNICYFTIDSVPSDFCGDFYISTYVDCKPNLGFTKCVKAQILPDSLCTSPDLSWDKSSITVEGYCSNDSLACFKITNKAKTNMAGPSEYRVYVDNQLTTTQNFQLSAGDSLVLCYPSYNKTLRLEADQRPGHPGKSKPRSSVEGCGDNAQAFSLGQIILTPEDDEDFSVEYECRVITGSYDPNEKIVKPIGVTNENLIDSTVVLDYHINFQNTGTDTAFTVVVYDTLSPFLDLTSLEMGAGSHFYTYKIYGHNILKVTFPNILLPDSNINEPMSHGFFKFKINQVKNNPYGTLIENSVGIVFDFNEPVITNTTKNKIGKPELISGEGKLLHQTNSEVSVFPNPFSKQISFALKTDEKYSLTITDVLGARISENTNLQGSFEYTNNNLLPGVYFYTIQTSSGKQLKGKIISK